ncbi:MAG: CPBP family intramembrane metalloprotease [Cyanobacteria bacterium]|nr:CPBP family intramembrane metalloprotease [Cyanobacteria bacterium bin.51]
MALVQLLGPAGGGDRFRVQHYEPRSGGFTGPLETVRIPRQAPDRDGRLPFNPQGLAGSAAGREGWYLYGAPDATGLFTAEALLPRQLFQIQPDSSVAGQSAGLRYLLHRNWKHTPERRGQLERVQLGAGTTARRWRLGDRGLLIHNFGGIGGRRGEPISGFTVTGHFAFGAVEVVPDPFSGEPRFEIRYHQIYANNPNGIIAGTQAASAYAGDLQRGWLWLRPISDVLIQQELFAGLNLGDRHFSLLDELALQAEVIMARYRSGDGTGLSSVTPATSCVQDSNQALFIAIRRLREKVQADSDLRDWLRRHPRHLETRKFRQLGQLADSLDQLLSPFGMVRSDWRSNAAIVAAAETGSATETAPTTGTAPPATPLFQRGEGLGVGLLSWRSMLPRRGHDDTARVFLQSGADLWFLRTNQLPGLDPSLEPLAPTLLFGQLPLVSILLRRTADALFTPLVGSAALVSGLVLLVYAGTALVIGERSGFLPRVGRRQSWRAPPVAAWLFPVAGLLVRPALLEEVFFRVALLPHPLEGAGIFSSLAWGALSVGLFVAYHPLAAATWYPRGRSLFWDPRFLSQCALLGVACVLAYDLTSSLWAPVLIHWLAVSLWLWPLGGRHRLAG